MENCLVTKLKASVNNNNLMSIGEFKCSTTLTTSPSFEIVSGSNSINLVITGDAQFKENGNLLGKNINIGASAYHQFTIQRDNEVDTSISLSLKQYYTLNTLDISGIGRTDIKNDSSFLKYASALTSFQVSVPGYNVDLSNFVNRSNMMYLTLNRSILSNLTSLGEFKTLNLLRVNSAVSSETISVEEIANGMVSNGRGSGVLNIDAYSTVFLTYNGVNCQTISLKFGSSMVNPTAEDTARGWQVA